MSPWDLLLWVGVVCVCLVVIAVTVTIVIGAFRGVRKPKSTSKVELDR